jgi:hypothetical protein
MTKNNDVRGESGYVGANAPTPKAGGINAPAAITVKKEGAACCAPTKVKDKTEDGEMNSPLQRTRTRLKARV